MALPTATLGATGLKFSRLGLGGAPLGELFEQLPEAQASDVVSTAYQAGITLFDTAPWYGHGLSEHRMGHTLRQVPRDSFVLSTKVGRIYRPASHSGHKTPPWAGGLPFELHFDYSYDGIMRSWADSLMRLGLNRVDMLVIHDLEEGYHEGAMLSSHRRALESGGYKALEELKASGQIQAIGAGVNDTSCVPYFLENFSLDFLLVAMPYTLLDQRPLQDVFPACEDKNVAVIIGSPYASGILAVGSGSSSATYNYAPANDDILNKVRQLETLCVQHGINLASAALQFCLAHPIIAATIPGATHARFVNANVKNLSAGIPAAFWEELKTAQLISPHSPTPRAHH